MALAVLIRRAPPQVIAASAAAAVVFLALAVLVAVGATRALDLAVIRSFQSIASDPLDFLANAHTLVGQLAVTLTAAAMLMVVIWRRHGGSAWLAPAFILGTGAIELVFKFMLRHPSPPEEFVRAYHNVLGMRLGSPSSFPSGHVARLAFLALLLATLYPSRWTGIVAAAFVALTVFARVYIGDHWISDALAGLALGTGAGAAAIGWMRATARR